MKQFFFTLLLLAGFAKAAEARTLTAAVNGNWDDATTWSPIGVPVNGDQVIIPFGKTVKLRTNENNMQHSKLDIRVAGVLDFVGNAAKMWISNQSVVYVYPSGTITAHENSQSLKIGGTTVINAVNNATTTITGPSVARAGNTTNNTANSNIPTGFAAYDPVALPVQFVAFTVTRSNGGALVQWSTSQEVNALDYNVELSTDGRNWNTLATVNAAGNSSSLRQYSFTAGNLPAGNLQFRVKQTDIDGKFTYTAIRTLKSGTDPKSIALNAGNGRLVLQFGEETKNVTVRVMNLNGQVLQEQKLGSALGQVLIPTTQKGYCIVAVLNESGLATSKQVLL